MTPIPSQPPARSTRLANGVHVVSLATPGSATTAVGLWLDVGAHHEPAWLSGATHLLEHMALKGGTHRRSARRIGEEIEDVGRRLLAHPRASVCTPGPGDAASERAAAEVFATPDRHER